MRNFIAIYALVGSSLFSLAQTVTQPHGEGSVVFGSPGGKWQKAVITDRLTGESSTAYSLDAETSATDIENKRRPRIAFSCQKSGEFERVQIRTGTVIANRLTLFPSPPLSGLGCRLIVNIRELERGLQISRRMVQIFLPIKE